MNKINWKVRKKNLLLWVQVIGTFLLTALAYNSMNPSDLTTWEGLGRLLLGVISNPFLLASCLWAVFNAITDPTTKGIKDSEQAQGYEKPKDDAYVEMVPEYETSADNVNATREEIGTEETEQIKVQGYEKPKE